MESAFDVWLKVMSIIEQNMTKITIDTWFDDTVPIVLSDDEFVIYSPSEYKRITIASRYAEFLEKALYEIFSMPIKIKVIDYLPTSPADDKKTDILDLNSHHTFNNFVVGRSNRYAYTYAKAVAETPGTEYNPLFIYGESGLGKTHLLFAIAGLVRENHPDYKIIYIKGDDFINDNVMSIQFKTTVEFREKYRNCDLFLVDDIQFIAQTDNVQTEFFHTFETLVGLGKQIVITSDRPPKNMPTLTDRLRNRFEWGLLTDIQKPDLETRIAIVKNKSVSLGVALPEDVIRYIAENITSNVRQLEGAVNKIVSQSKLMGIEPNLTNVASIIRDLYKDSTERMPTVPLIIKEVCSYYNIDEKQLKGSGRSTAQKIPRYVSMYLIRDLMDMTFEAIGAEFGQHHSTVMNGISQIEKLLSSPGTMSDTIRDLKSNISYRLEN